MTKTKEQEQTVQENHATCRENQTSEQQTQLQASLEAEGSIVSRNDHHISGANIEGWAEPEAGQDQRNSDSAIE
jgi:hypothetical protein